MRVCAIKGLRSSTQAAGFTLLELIVVLLLLALASAVVAPSLLSNRTDPRSALDTLIGNAKGASIRRGAMVHLRVDRAGNWQASAGVSSASPVLMAGKLDPAPASAVDLIFSPLGTCGSAQGGDQSATLAAYDALTCELRPR